MFLLNISHLLIVGKSFKDVPTNCSYKGVASEYDALIMFVNMLCSLNILLPVLNKLYFFILYY